MTENEEWSRAGWSRQWRFGSGLLLAMRKCSPHQTANRATSGFALGVDRMVDRHQKGIGTGSGSHTWAAWQALVILELSIRADRQEKDATTGTCTQDGIGSQSFFRALAVASGLMLEECFLRNGFLGPQYMKDRFGQQVRRDGITDNLFRPTTMAS